MKNAEKEPGEWNVYEIELRGQKVKASVNGTLVNEAGAEVIAGADRAAVRGRRNPLAGLS